jgi:hypothetical protein
MKWHPNSNKHKATHGGYRDKPSKKDVNALLDLYGNISTLKSPVVVSKQEKGIQLKFNF